MKATEYFYENYLGRRLRDNERDYLSELLFAEVNNYGIQLAKYRRFGSHKPYQFIKIRYNG